MGLGKDICMDWCLLGDCCANGAAAHGAVVFLRRDYCLLFALCVCVLYHTPQPPSGPVHGAHPHHWPEEAAGCGPQAALLLGVRRCIRSLEGVLRGGRRQ